MSAPYLCFSSSAANLCSRSVFSASGMVVSLVILLTSSSSFGASARNSSISLKSWSTVSACLLISVVGVGFGLYFFLSCS